MAPQKNMTKPNAPSNFKQLRRSTNLRAHLKKVVAHIDAEEEKRYAAVGEASHHIVNYFNNPQDPNVMTVAADVKKKRVHIKHMALLLDIEKAVHAFYKANYKTCDVVDDDGVPKVARVVLKLVLNICGK